jgi:hypothetical protein
MDLSLLLTALALAPSLIVLSGRPMTKEGYAFCDSVSGASVYFFRDLRGRRWMAENQWSLFRVEARN